GAGAHRGVTAGPRSPGRPRSAEADAAIVRATLEVLREEGFRGLSVETVRRRAGVGKATIYRRFPDREALVRAALAAANPPVAGLPDTGSVRDDLRRVFHAVYDAAAGPMVAAAAPIRLLAEAGREPELHALFREALIEPRRAAVRTLLRRGIDRGELAADADVELLIDMLAGSVV